MDSKAVGEAIVSWVQESIPAIVGAYDFGTDTKPEGLPDVQAELLRHRFSTDDPLFPFSQLQQFWLHIWEFGISFMVDNSNPQAADEQLKDFSDTLLAAIQSDGTLGGRVDIVSPFISFDFTSPFVEYASDGTKGREMTLTLAVAERLEPPQ